MTFSWGHFLAVWPWKVSSPEPVFCFVHGGNKTSLWKKSVRQDISIHHGPKSVPQHRIHFQAMDTVILYPVKSYLSLRYNSIPLFSMWTFLMSLACSDLFSSSEIQLRQESFWGSTLVASNLCYSSSIFLRDLREEQFSVGSAPPAVGSG